MAEKDHALPTISQDDLTIKVDPLGAQLMSIEKGGTEYLWQGDGRWWPRRAPVLFPIVGRLRDDRATSAEGPLSMGQHGIARNLVFDLVEKTPAELRFRLTSDKETRKAYPYDFAFEMVYGLTDDGAVAQTFRVENPGRVDLPFVVGGHPAFNVPVDPASGETFDDYELVFEAPMTWSVPRIEGGLINWDDTEPVLKDEAVIPVTHRLFDKDALIFKDVPGNKVTLRGTKSGHGMAVEFPGFGYLGIWSAAGDAPFVALEPWVGCATGSDEDDVFEHKRAMVSLAPGDVFEATFTMRPF